MQNDAKNGRFERFLVRNEEMGNRSATSIQVDEPAKEL